MAEGGPGADSSLLGCTSEVKLGTWGRETQRPLFHTQHLDGAYICA